MRRRRFLLTGAAAALAGCLGGSGSEGDGSNSNGGGSGGGTSLNDHPAARDLAAQPALGPEPGTAEGTIVVFEDPSCPSCRRFETKVVPELRSKLVDAGQVTLVVRGYPVIYEWGKPATRALEATLDASVDAFWQLHGHYFANQGAYHSAGVDEVYPRTRSFLDGQTDVDAEGVVDAAHNGEFDAAVRTDLDAGRAAEVRATPTLFLFREGQYQTKATGVVGYETLTSVLGL